ncbi:glycosyltransferase family 9 protein [Humisphaera borealis]|uniref:Glycosyltransferase family 9 protein n=1 Tax=Humisphaera borealis TaxID=2807512 RepID=A0A7M2X2S6_9BACT|nr:glycosyltransferase family 9 protein [Humisphaera borealis]QOV91732.1 glycosyltransferase family 9 protein [Humisphaera borealis]
MVPPASRIAASPKLNDPRKRRIVILLDALVRPFRGLLTMLSPKPRGGRPRRILLIRMDGIGDLMMSTAIFSALRDQYPGARIDLLCSTLVKPLASVLVDTGRVDRLHLLPLYGVTFAMWRRTIATLRAARYDVAADLRGDFRNIALAWLAKIPRRIGIPYSGWEFLATETLPFEIVHTAEEVGRIAERLGVPDAPRQPQFELPPTFHQWAEQWLAQSDANTVENPRRPLIALHLSAGQPARIWPIANFISICRTLAKDCNARFVVIGGPGMDVDFARELNRHLDEPAVVAAAVANLPRTAAIMSRCALFIGTDSGPAHIAAAVGCPVVVFFGPGNESVMRPFARQLRIVRAKHACEPLCANKVCVTPDHHCLASITPGEVAAASKELLAGT